MQSSLVNRMHTPIQRLLLIFIAAASLGATAYITVDVVMHPRDRVGPAPAPLWEAPAFTMIDQDGQPFAREQLRGRPWVAAFFFTSCPMICPQMNQKMAALQADLEALGDQAAGVKLVNISIDPATDRPARLKEYATLYEADPDRWVFLTHPEGDRDAVWEMVGVEGFKMTLYDTPDDPSGNIIEHTPRFMLIDHAGMVRDTYDSRDAEAMAQLRQDIRAVVAEAR